MFKTLLLEKIDKHAPIISKKVQGRNCPWLSSELKSELNKKDQLLRKARRTGNEYDWSLYRLQRNKANRLLRLTKNRYHQSVLNENSNNPEQFWKIIEDLYPTKSTNANSRSFKIDNEITTNKTKIASGFNDLTSFSLLLHQS